MIARLDNEVFFKKAFTDQIVFKAFVKDIVGIDVEPDSIETEKSFAPKLGNVNFKYDIFAEDSKNRVVIEIQRIEYDHNFDRFLHYHLQAITEQQRSSDNYSVARTVYTIIVLTAPYRLDDNGQVFKDEVLVSSINPRNLKGIERPIYNHQLIFLNPNYKDNDTPQNYRDWLDLINESIHNAENPNINFDNEGIKRASEIITYDLLDPHELEKAKIASGKKIVEQLDKRDHALEIALKMHESGIAMATIAECTQLSEEWIKKVIENQDK